MQHKNKIIEYYHSGRYQCDYQTHLQLKSIIIEMNMYEWIPIINKEIEILAKIKQLTQINANCLDQDYDDQQGLCQTYKIRQLINSLNVKQILKIIQQCQALHWQSYQSKALKILAGNSQYLSIVERIQNSIKSQEFRRDSMLFVAFFYHINGNSLQTKLLIYQQTMEYYLNYLTKERNKFHLLIQNSQYSNIMQTSKVKNYVGVAYFIIKCCLRYCDILKVLTGKNNLSLKFTVVKKQIQRMVKCYKEWKFQTEKQQIFSSIKVFKQHLKSNIQINKESICRWCLKQLKKEKDQHAFCHILINKKQFFN